MPTRTGQAKQISKYHIICGRLCEQNRTIQCEKDITNTSMEQYIDITNDIKTCFGLDCTKNDYCSSDLFVLLTFGLR